MADWQLIRPRTRSRPVFDEIAVGCLFGLFFYYLELLETSQDPYWLGGSGTDWYESLVGLGMYTFWPIACGLAMRGLFRRRGAAALAGLLGAGGGAGLLWAWIRPDSSSLSGLDCTVPGVLLGLLGLLAVAEWTGLVSIRAWAAAWSLAVLGGIAALREGSLLFILSSQGPALCPAVSLLGVALAGIGGMAICVVAMRRDARAILAAGFLVVLCGALPLALRLAPWVLGLWQKPTGSSVMVVTADALRADACSLYGGDAATPSMEALAGRGVLFKRHEATAPWTVPSLDSLFSGRYPPGLTPGGSDEQHHREELSYYRLSPYWTDPEDRTVMDRLRHPKRNYATAAVVGNIALWMDRWLQNDFGDFVFLDSLYTDRPAFLRQLPLLRKQLAGYFPALNDTKKADSTWALTRYAREFLRQHRNSDFFLWVHFMDPHTPYNPPGCYRTSTGRWPQFPPPDLTRANSPAFFASLTAEEKQYVRSLYNGEVQYVDYAVGEILATWDALGIGDHGYFMFSSDHGEELWDHARWGHGHTLYEEQIHIPMVLMGPGLKPGVVEEPTSAIDVMPTLAHLLKLDPARQWPGQSLTRFLDAAEGAGATNPVFSQATQYQMYKREPEQTVVSGRFKLIRGLETGQTQLYDLTADPSEQHDAAQENPDAVAKLGAALDVWSKSFPASFGEFEKRGGFETPSERSAEMEEIFRALGYF